MQRPSAVTAFGILNIVFGGLGVLCTPMSLIFLWFQRQSDLPLQRIMDITDRLFAYWVVMAVLGELSALALIAAGIGLLQLRPWARILSIAYGIFSIIVGVVGMFVNAVFVFGPALSGARSGGPEAAGSLVGVAAGSIGGIVGLVYPVLLLVFMTRPRIRDAFHHQEAPPVLG